VVAFKDKLAGAWCDQSSVIPALGLVLALESTGERGLDRYKFVSAKANTLARIFSLWRNRSSMPAPSFSSQIWFIFWKYMSKICMWCLDQDQTLGMLCLDWPS
jgi:hypothetical protein